ncbi:MAG: ADP-ribosylglycohydrolase family protein, partial [Prevotellaceae bacterium]|nr:ADP-ribosylglycohydrolase family protein [Prevotellaceae bacterium]
MLGAIIGDIIGSRFEFNNHKSVNFELFTDECSFTDDTICTVAVADALLKGVPFSKSLRQWCSRYPHPKGGYGGSFAAWLRSDNPQPYNSFGNGSAMRVSPV